MCRNSLHDEIITFCKWVSPTVEEKQMREDVISRISKVVESLWPSVQLQVFGSCATDIYLPTSDIDLCIMGATTCSSSPIDELAMALRNRSMGRLDLQLILNYPAMPNSVYVTSLMAEYKLLLLLVCQ